MNKDTDRMGFKIKSIKESEAKLKGVYACRKGITKTPKKVIGSGFKFKRTNYH